MAYTTPGETRSKVLAFVRERLLKGEAPTVREVQSAFGRAPGDLWLVGLYNLTGDLDADETAALAEIISRWWNKPLLRFTVSELQVMGASDDLVLDAHVETVLPLGA